MEGTTREGAKREGAMQQGAMQQGMAYGRFLLMVATSTVLMFVLMYFNTFSSDDVRFSQTRLWMALVMGATMAAVMLGFMWSMYKDKRRNVGILAASAVVFALSLWLVRSQQTVGDVSYMRAMIPHHSIAIMTSERAHLRDPRVRRLAEGIIDAQRREIAEMDYLVRDIEAHGVRGRGEPARGEPARGAR